MKTIFNKNARKNISIRVFKSIRVPNEAFYRILEPSTDSGIHTLEKDCTHVVNTCKLSSDTYG